MNRVLLICNAVPAVLLAVAVVQQSGMVHAVGGGAVLEAPDLRVMVVGEWELVSDFPSGTARQVTLPAGFPGQGRLGLAAEERRVDGFFAPPEDLQESSFGSSASVWGEQSAPPGALPILEGRLAPHGPALLSFPPATARTRVLQARFEVSVLDPSGRAVRARGVVAVHRQDFHLGLRVRDQDVELVGVNADGSPVAVREAATVFLEYRKWQRQRVRPGVRTWRHETMVVAEQLEEVVADLGMGRTRLSFSSPHDRQGVWQWPGVESGGAPECLEVVC